MYLQRISVTNGGDRTKWLVVILCLLISARVHAQLVCSSGTATARGTVGSDGKRHVKVMGTGNPTVDARIEDARTEWNGFSNTTNVVFDIVTSEPFDLKFTMDDAQTGGGCAFFNGSNRIYIAEGYATQDWASNMQALTKTVFSHEVGHYLGVAQNQDSSANSIMVGAQSGTNCTEMMNSIPSGARNVTSADASKAGECVQKGKGGEPGSIYDTYDENQECWDYFHVTEYWWCDWDPATGAGYCSFMYEDREYLYTDCNPPI